MCSQEISFSVAHQTGSLANLTFERYWPILEDRSRGIAMGSNILIKPGDKVTLVLKDAVLCCTVDVVRLRGLPGHPAPSIELEITSGEQLATDHPHPTGGGVEPPA